MGSQKEIIDSFSELRVVPDKQQKKTQKKEQITNIKSHVQMDKSGPKRPFNRESDVQIDTTFTHEMQCIWCSS